MRSVCPLHLFPSPPLSINSASFCPQLKKTFFILKQVPSPLTQAHYDSLDKAYLETVGPELTFKAANPSACLSCLRCHIVVIRGPGSNSRRNSSISCLLVFVDSPLCSASLAPWRVKELCDSWSQQCINITKHSKGSGVIHFIDQTLITCRLCIFCPHIDRHLWPLLTYCTNANGRHIFFWLSCSGFVFL